MCVVGSLSCTYAKPIHKLDQPTMPWPHAPFPKLKYPLAEHEEANMAEEMRCLDEVQRFSPPCIVNPAKTLTP